MKKLFLIFFLLFVAEKSATAGAMYVYQGSFNVQDGPYWEDNPPVYSALEAAALIFGGSVSDYAISVNSSQDSSTITHSAYYAGWGDYGNPIFAEDFKLDLGGNGYNSFLGDDPYQSAYSAFVNDSTIAANYVWRIVFVTDIPEPSTYALFAFGILGIFMTASISKRF